MAAARVPYLPRTVSLCSRTLCRSNRSRCQQSLIEPRYSYSSPTYRNPAQQRRSYHSHNHESPPPFPPAESAILSAALSHVPTHGFSTAALCQGARDAGYLDASINLFPRAAFDLVNYYLVIQRLALTDSVQFPTQRLSVGAKVRALALQRLHANEPIIHQWQGVSFHPIILYHSLVPLTLTGSSPPLKPCQPAFRSA